MVGLGFHYSVFSTYNFDTYQFGIQHEPVPLVALRKLSVPQLSAGPLGVASSATLVYIVGYKRSIVLLEGCPVRVSLKYIKPFISAIVPTLASLSSLQRRC